jgi:hypothetical protein
MSDETSADRPQAELWYATESDPFRALHDVLELARGEDRQLYECGGWSGRPESAVQAVLGAAGFIGAEPRPVSVRALDPGVEVVRHFGFAVEDEALGAVEEAIRTGLRGDLGGFTAVLMGQVGFHRSVYAFAHVWTAAGKPPILLVHPSADRSHARGQGGPATLLGPHEIDARARLALSRFRELSSQRR